MKNINQSFGEVLLAQIKPLIRKHLTKETKESISFYKYSDGHGEVAVRCCKQFPEGFYSYFSANYMSEIRYEGYSRILTKLGVME